MPGQASTNPSRHIVAVAAGGAALGGAAGFLLAPDFFWALLIGGALMGGAVRVGAILLRGEPGK